MIEVVCQNCGAHCSPTSEKFQSRSELGFMIPNTVYVCDICHWKHIICPECEGDGNNSNNNSNSIVATKNNECPHCLGEGTVVIERVKSE